MSASRDEWVAVGRVRRVRGIRGDVLVEPLSDVPDRLTGLPDVRGVTRDGGSLVLHLERVARAGRDYTVHFEGVDDRTAAERLAGCILETRRGEGVTLPPGAYFVSDIVGLTVETEEGRALGRVTEVMQPGANDVYVVEGDEGEVLLPAIPDVIRAVDLAGGRLVVRLLPGLEPE